MELKADLKGLGDIVAALRAIPEELRKNGGPVNSGMRKAARIVRDEARRLAPKKSGLMAESIIAVRDPNPRRTPGASERYVIGVKGGGKAKYANNSKNRRARKAGAEYEKQGNAYYFRFVEFGTEKQPAQPFLRPAIQTKAGEAIEAAAEAIDKGITRAARKARKAAKK